MPLSGNSVAAFLTQPMVAGLLGIAVGALMLYATYRGSRFMTADNPELGAARAVALLGAGLIGAFACLLLYYLFARDGLVPFGIGLIVGFMVPAFVMLFVISGTAKPTSGGGR